MQRPSNEISFGRFRELVNRAFPGWQIPALVLWIAGVAGFWYWYSDAVFWGQMILTPAVGIAWFFGLALLGRLVRQAMKRPPTD